MPPKKAAAAPKKAAAKEPVHASYQGMYKLTNLSRRRRVCLDCVANVC